MSTPTTEQLRARIDRGETGEKVDFPDPAAVPLGADAEAGGHPPTVLERAMDAGRPRSRQLARPRSGFVLYALLVAGAFGLVLFAGLAGRW